jgi:hypothetical protein
MGNEANSQIEKISRSAGSARVSLSYSYQSNYNLSPMLLVGWGKVLSQTKHTHIACAKNALHTRAQNELLHFPILSSLPKTRLLSKIVTKTSSKILCDGLARTTQHTRIPINRLF